MQLSDRNRRDTDGLVKNLNRMGRVVERKTDKSGVWARVQYNDRQDLISNWLPVGQPSAGGLRIVSSPRIGQEVAVNHLGNSIEHGWISGTIYTPTNPPPPVTDPDQIVVQLDDGGLVFMDPATGDFLLDFKGPVNIKTVGPANIEAEGPVAVKSAADVRLESAGDITLRAGGEIILETGGGGPRIRIMANGDMLQPDGEHTDRIGKHSGGRERKEEADDL
jgi:phage baseplate assembly protein V